MKTVVRESEAKSTSIKLPALYQCISKSPDQGMIVLFTEEYKGIMVHERPGYNRNDWIFYISCTSCYSDGWVRLPTNTEIVLSNDE